MIIIISAVSIEDPDVTSSRRKKRQGPGGGMGAGPGSTPVVTSITPSKGTSGEKVLIQGTGFSLTKKDITVHFYGMYQAMFFSSNRRFRPILYGFLTPPPEISTNLGSKWAHIQGG